MTRFQIYFTIAAALAAIGSAAIAQDSKERAPDGEHLLTMMDANGDGAITGDEISAYRTAMFAEIDTDGDGTLTAEELIARHEARRAARRARRKAARYARHFNRLDSDGNGGVSIEEFTSARPPIMDRLDTDGDGTISAEELANAPQRPDGHGPRHGGQ